VEETRACILPFASAVNPDMFRELSDLVDSRERLLPLLARGTDTRRTEHGATACGAGCETPKHRCTPRHNSRECPGDSSA